MLTTASLAAVALLVSSVSSMPNVRARATDSLTPWVTVDESGTAHTVTPYVTTVDGTATTVSAAPNDITGSVFTQTNFGEVTTSTGTAPAPTATATDGAGSFAVCNNKDGTLAPWCSPNDNAKLYPGTSYYCESMTAPYIRATLVTMADPFARIVIWDSSYFAANTSIKIQGNYLNSSSGEITSQAFISEKMLASWGFWSLTVTSDLLQGKVARNISVQIAAVNATSGTSSTFIKGPQIQVTQTPTYHAGATTLPSGAALYIGLPSIFGFIILCLAGTCIWNRKHRKINLGNVMSRSRHGHGLGKVGRGMGMGKRRREKQAAERVQLMEREVAAEGGQIYRDEPSPDPQPDHFDLPHIPRRDSNELGSLAGTPTEDKRMDFPHADVSDGRRSTESASTSETTDAKRNIFREEIRRQNERAAAAGQDYHPQNRLKEVRLEGLRRQVSVTRSVSGQAKKLPRQL